MTDDIVTRLRENCDTSDCVNVRSIALVKCDNCDAADEIERSWIEWSLWKMTAEQLARELGKVAYAEQTYEDTKKAWNG